jgi:hypothetical protein
MMGAGNKVEQYKSILTAYVEGLADRYNTIDGVKLEYQAIADHARGHFQLVKLGWIDQQYIHAVLMHFDVKSNGKVWIQLNDTETLVAQELMEQGIKQSDLVLGFKPEYARPYTGFAVA